MPRRRALTAAQLAGLRALPATEAGLIRHWTLGDADLAAIGRRRRPGNRLGFALQLLALRYPGRPLRPGEAVPEPAPRFVADAVGAEEGAIAAYGARAQTRYAPPSASPTSRPRGGGRSRPGSSPSRSPRRTPPRSPRRCWTRCGGAGW